MEIIKTKINSLPQQGVFNFTTLVSLYAFDEKKSEHAFPHFIFILCFVFPGECLWALEWKLKTVLLRRENFTF